MMQDAEGHDNVHDLGEQGNCDGASDASSENSFHNPLSFSLRIHEPVGRPNDVRDRTRRKAATTLRAESAPDPTLRQFGKRRLFLFTHPYAAESEKGVLETRRGDLTGDVHKPDLERRDVLAALGVENCGRVFLRVERAMLDLVENGALRLGAPARAPW